MMPEALDLAAREAAGRGGPAWLQARRLAASSQLAKDGLPTTAEEAWRYTDIAPIVASIRTVPDRSATAPSPPAGIRHLYAEGESIRVLMDDTGIRHATGEVDGVRLASFLAADTASARAIQQTIEAAAGAGPSALEHINTALLADGLFIDVLPGADVAVPIELVLAGERDAQHRVVVRIGSGASATIVLHHASRAGTGNTVVDIDVGPSARLALVRLQTDAAEANHLSCIRLRAGQDARIDLQQLDLGAGLSRNDLLVMLSGPGARFHLQGLLFADARRHVDQYALITHEGPQTASTERVRGVADGHGQAVFNGRIVVTPRARGADARLTNQNLLLSPTAEVDARPELEILTDDVRCSHGSTTGQLDPAALFYLRSRGIGADEARQLLVSAFVQEIIDQAPGRVPVAALRAVVGAFRPAWQAWQSGTPA